MPKKPIDKGKALERLKTLCSRSEQCEFDLNRKMINWGISSADRKEVIDSLRKNRFVDDARFAKSYANDKSRFSAWGPHKIKAELIRRRIKSPLISEAIQNVDQKVWKEGLMRYAVNKAKNLTLTGEDGWENSQKLFRYLISRGFPSSASGKVINLLRKREEENQDD